MNKKQFLLIIVLTSAFNVAIAVASQLSWANHSEPSAMIIQSMGYLSPALSSDCVSTRNPALESVCTCLGDLPGGYCYHVSCGSVAAPTLTDQPDQIQVSHP